MFKRTTVRLPENLLNRAKLQAARKGRTLSDLIEDGLRRVLNDQEKVMTAKRKLPRVSSATGGLMPGIDISDSAALQEMDDLETANRWK
jgi:predicted DNA-binding protein